MHYEVVPVPVTIKDIARAARMSHSTVSRALRNHPSVSAETTARIQRIAEEMGYVPSAVARSLKTSRTRVIGVIVNRIADPFFSRVLDGIQDVVQDRTYSLFLASANYGLNDDQAIQAMVERRIDGLIICATYMTREYRERLDRQGVPSVLVHNRSAEDAENAIYHDDIFGGQQMTRHLIDLGHRRIAYLGNAHAGRSSHERLQGYRMAHAEAGLSVREDYVLEANSGTAQSGAWGASTLMALSEPPTALFCYNDLMAIGAMSALQKAGLQVPGDWSIVGFDNITLSAFVNPPLTTFDQPKYRLGQQAARMMFDLLDDDSEAAPRPGIVILRGSLLARESAAPPAE